MTLDAIKDAVVHLSEVERKQFADWFEELEEDIWDRQMEQDFAPGGRGAHLIAEAKADVLAGRVKPLHEFLAEAKSQRQLLNPGA